jgi:hypothetical protein
MYIKKLKIVRNLKFGFLNLDTFFYFLAAQSQDPDPHLWPLHPVFRIRTSESLDPKH